jgi:hypothetical protein
VTYTGTGSARTVAHNLGSVPGCIIVKRTDASGFDWTVYHISTGNTQRLNLNTTDPAGTATSFWNDTTPTSTVFTVGSNSNVNASGGSYVAYLFAHDAGGFPVSGGGSTNGITCGTFTTDGTGAAGNITLGYEPQWILLKQSGGVDSWNIIDITRGSSLTSYKYLQPNASTQESSSTTTQGIYPTATGFFVGTNYPAASATYIYIAIRRGPMKTPTVGTSVLELQNLDNLVVDTLVSSTVVPDMALQVNDLGARYVVSRLTGGINTASSSSTSPRQWLVTNETSVENTGTTGLYYQMQNASFRLAGNGADPGSSFNLAYFLKRAPGFMDVVCYTGTEVSGQTFNHNLGAVPEMMIVKSRSDTTDWTVYHSALGASARIYLNATNAANTGTAAPWNSTTPTSSVFSLGNAGATNLSGATFVNYLFATVAGVSKVGSYTGTGALQTVNCGFTAGARFVLIKRTDSTGGWYVYDSVRGITSGDDPYLFLNNIDAQVTNTNYVDTDTTGFKVTAAAPSGLNASGGTYIFLAIA